MRRAERRWTIKDNKTRRRRAPHTATAIHRHTQNKTQHNPTEGAAHAPQGVRRPAEDALGVEEEDGALPHQVREAEAEDDGQRQEGRDRAAAAGAAGALGLVAGVVLYSSCGGRGGE